MKRNGFRCFHSYREANARPYSWPVCTSQVRYQQQRTEYSQRTWGAFTIPTALLAEAVSQEAKLEAEFVHVDDVRLAEWFADFDAEDLRKTNLPSQWTFMDHVVRKLVESHKLGCFCIKCNRDYTHRELIWDNGRSRSASKAAIIMCPRIHPLLMMETIRGVPSSPWKGRMGRFKRIYEARMAGRELRTRVLANYMVSQPH